MGSNRKKPKKYISLFFVLCLLVFGLANEVKSKENILAVSVEITAQCVMHFDRIYTGFDIELWEEIAQELEFDYSYKETNLKGIFKDITESKADFVS